MQSVDFAGIVRRSNIDQEKHVKRLLTLTTTLLITMSACGDDGNGSATDTTTTDTTVADTTVEDTTVEDTTVEDTTVEDTTVEDTTVADTTASTCTQTGFTAVAEDAGDLGGYFRYIAQTTITAGEPVSLLTFELIPEIGAEGPGTYELEGDNYVDCGNCITISQNCDDDLLNCEKAFLVQQGTLTITSWGDSGGTFEGTLTDAVFAEATFADDLTSTVVDGGDSWCLGSFAFSATVQ
ncbi:MAG: hypothetical protein ACI9MR_001967 [Myxococcota bacterium]